ncbi:MAG: lamin tail domain-containing protein [Roseibacillus sp.]
MAAMLAYSSAHGQVRLNEIGASSSERLLTRNSNGVAHLGGGAQWWELQFDTVFWKTGRTPIGFGYGGLATDVRADVRRVTPTLYVRQEFQATAAQAGMFGTLSLQVNFDDAFIAYLNGVEVARGNAGAPGAYLYADQVAYQARAANGSGINFPIGPSNQLLRTGDNVLAVEVHNVLPESGNLKLDTILSAPGASFINSGAPCEWFPGVLSPSGGVFDPSLVFDDPAVVVALPAPEFEDWIELHNAGPLGVDLSGWGLSDEVANPLKWKFPAGTFLGAGGRLLVIADGREELNGFTTHLHCGFKLSAGGEALSLSDATGVLQSEFPGGFPPQYPTHSYGWDPVSATYGYLENATPGAANIGPALSDRVDAPDFDQKGGFYSSTVTLTLTSSTPGATIRYTLDASEPTETNGTIYTLPLTLTPLNNKTGRVVWARAYKSGQIPSKSKSHTYLINQDRRIQSIPALIFTGEEEEIFYKPHGIMSIEGGNYVSNLWRPNGINSYNIPINRGIQYERPVRLEFYHADGTPGFREDAGVRLAASSYSRPRLRLDNVHSSPWPSSGQQKPSFNLYFRNDYGESSLDYPWLGETYPATSFEQLRIRAGKNDIRNPWIRDELMRRLYSEMGQESSVGITNTLYINGSFKGFFNMTERLREPFMQAHHGGNEEWDVRQVGDFPNGDSRIWDRMMVFLNRNLTNIASWQAAEAFLDPINMADYFLLNIYGTTWDWPQNNWVGARERTAEGKYRLYIWDAEGTFGHNSNFPASRNSILVDLLNKTNPLSNLFKRLITSPEWRLTFADRVHKHMFNGGVLDDRTSGSRLRLHVLLLRREFQAILSFVHGESPNIAFYNTWTAPNTGRRAYLLGPTRTYLADHGFWPAVAPPIYNQHGGEIAAGFQLTMSAEPGKVIHYTLDGSDPRVPGGAISAGAATYGTPVALNASRILVKSRAYESATATWSALTEAGFEFGLVAPDSNTLVISEMMYHPADVSGSEAVAGFSNQDDFEFIELKNVSGSELDLNEVAFTAGISFSFAGSIVTTLLPGERVLVVADLAAFRQRYGTAMDSRIAGEFGGALSNREDTVTLSLEGSTVQTLHRMSYLDVAPWPDCADGPGHSLFLASPDTAPDHDDPANWICSPSFGGELGGDGLVFDYGRWTDFTFDAAQAGNPAISGALANPDGDNLNNFGEFALGSDPLVHDSAGNLPSVGRTRIGDSNYLVMEFRRSRFQLPVIYTLQVSSGLDSWTNVPPGEIEAAAPVVESDGRVRERWRFLESASSASARFLRIVVTLSIP